MKTIFLLAISSLIYINSVAQNQNIISPKINEDKSVTFQLFSPKASEVKISGDWLPYNDGAPGTATLKKDEQDIWTYTSKPLPSELYSYSFIVDGMRTLDPNNVYMIRDVATVANVFIVDGGQGDLYQVSKIPHGTVTHRWYSSAGNGKERRITIYTPPGYETSKHDFPVLYLLHGMGGDEEAWITLGRTAQIMDNLIAQGLAEPMIVVMPNGNVSQDAAPGESSEGFVKPTFQLPQTMDGKMEETFPEIIEFIEKNYRTIKNKNSRAIAGLSMGGFHSLHISRHYPDTFSYIGLFSPAIMPRNESASLVYRNFEPSLKNQKDKGFRLYWIAIGKTDFLYEEVEDYRKKLDDLGFNYEYLETEGGHTWANWRIYLSKFVPRLFK